MRVLRMISLMVLSFVPIAALSAQAQQVQVSGTNRTIAVTATAQAKAKADTATINIGYQIYGPTSDAVTDEAGKISKAIAEALVNAGVPKDAIESETQSTSPVPPFQQNEGIPQERAQRQFSSEQSWILRTRAADAAAVLAAATAAGANNSGAIEWSLTDEDALSAEAATKALKHAKEIAGQMAAGLGVTLRDLLYASNETQTVRVMAMAQRSIGGGGGGGTQERKTLSLSAPMVTRSATVSAVFAIQ